MKLSNILVPYDGSEHALRAVDYAKGLAAMAGAGARVSVVHVVTAGMVDPRDLDGEGTLNGVPLGLVDREEYQLSLIHICFFKRASGAAVRPAFA